MRTVGKLRPDGSGFAGSIRTLAINLPRVRLVAIGVKRSDQSPDWTVECVSADGDMVEVGAAWKKTSQAGAKYISLTLDDPSFPSDLNLAAMPDEGPDGAEFWRVLWSRPQHERAAA